MLEASGIFEALKLQTNYRSNPEILEFANTLLADIKANRYANLRLKSNYLTPLTKDSFKEAVKIYNHRYKAAKDLLPAMGPIFHKELKKYVDEKLDLNEKICFLAYEKKYVMEIQNILNQVYPDKPVLNLIPNKSYMNTLFTQYIKSHWDEVQFINGQYIMDTIIGNIFTRLKTLSNAYTDQKMQLAINNCKSITDHWRNTSTNKINNWIVAHNSGQINKTELLDLIKNDMIETEKLFNNSKQKLISQKNTERKTIAKQSNAPFIISTIHSAKGLEFDNVVVLVKDDNLMSEENKRMYYVALTRAMKSEFIIGYSTYAHPKLEVTYNEILERLP